MGVDYKQSSLRLQCLSSPVCPQQARFLYNLLQQRKQSISHKRMPTYAEHIAFIENHPYREWFLIYLRDTPIGSLYLGLDNSVGLHFIEGYDVYLKPIIIIMEQLLTPLPPLKSIRSESFFFNIPPGNRRLRRILEDSGYYPTQLSMTKGVQT